VSYRHRTYTRDPVPGKLFSLKPPHRA
jgi:hypothetical protein